LLTDQCGFGEVTGIRCGLEVPATASGLEKGLIEMLSDPDGLRKSGENLEGYIRSKYTWDTIITKYIELYNEVLTKGYVED